MAVNKFQSGGVDNNWGTTGNWSQGTVPTASDGHITTFDATSPNCTVNTQNRVANHIDFTGYTNTITMTFTISVSGDITLDSGMGVAGASSLIHAATGTLTSDGKTWPNNFQFSTVGTSTLADNWTVAGNLVIGTTPAGINGNQITINGGISITAGVICLGTTAFLLNGTGTLGGATFGTLRNNTTINTSGTITIGTAFNFSTGTLTYTAGTVVTTSSTLGIAASATLACAGITWNNVTFTGAPTVTLSEALNVNGLITFTPTGSTITINGSEVNAAGGIRMNSTTGVVTGTSTFNVISASTLDGPTVTTMRFGNPLNINAPSDTITISTSFIVNFNKVLITSVGSIITTDGTWDFEREAGAGGPVTKRAGSNMRGNML